MDRVDRRPACRQRKNTSTYKQSLHFKHGPKGGGDDVNEAVIERVDLIRFNREDKRNTKKEVD